MGHLPGDDIGPLQPPRATDRVILGRDGHPRASALAEGVSAISGQHSQPSALDPAEVEALKAEISSLKENVKDLDTDIKDLIKENQGTKELLRKEHAQVIYLETEVKELNRDADIYKRTQERQSDEISDLETQLSDKDKELDEVKAESEDSELYQSILETMADKKGEVFTTFIDGMRKEYLV